MLRRDPARPRSRRLQTPTAALLTVRMRVVPLRVLALTLIAAAAAAAAGSARASQVVTTATGTQVQLGVNDKGEAMLSYTQAGKRIHVLAWGAVNASPPSTSKPQVKLQLEYDGGFKKQFTDNPVGKAALAHLRDLQAQLAQATAVHDTAKRVALAAKIKTAFADLAKLREQAANYWQTFSCPAYDGPPLAWKAAACKAPDGSYWAAQSWQRALPNYGVAPTAAQSAYEIHLSHWTGDLPVLTISTDWAYHVYDHLFGTFLYNDGAVYGFRSTAGGQPLDTYGRNLYVDTFNSVYGSGWRRENSFLTHKPTGAFCYSFNPHGSHPAGKGEQYRATIMGPGVTPDVMWQGPSPGPYDKAADATANQEIAALNDTLCKPN